MVVVRLQLVLVLVLVHVLVALVVLVLVACILLLLFSCPVEDLGLEMEASPASSMQIADNAGGEGGQKDESDIPSSNQLVLSPCKKGLPDTEPEPEPEPVPEPVPESPDVEGAYTNGTPSLPPSGFDGIVLPKSRPVEPNPL